MYEVISKQFFFTDITNIQLGIFWYSRLAVGSKGHQYETG